MKSSNPDKIGCIESVNPIKYKNWNDLILKNKGYSIFHSREWCQLLNETYGYNPCYLTIFNENDFDFMMPFMEVDSIFTGSRFVSLPFSDYCEPIIKNNFNIKELIRTVKNVRRGKSFNYFDIKGGAYLFDKEKIYNEGYIHKLDLCLEGNIIYSNLQSSNKRNIKKAIKKSVRVGFSNDYKSIVEFYRLNILTRQRHGIPPQPFKFFKNLYNILRNPGLFEIVEASYKDKIIASCLFLLFGKKVVYKFGASDYAYQNLRPNDLLFWEAIKHYSQLGFEEISFGRTEKRHTSLRQFKLGWGVDEYSAPYYRYNLKNGTFISNQSFDYTSPKNLGINKYLFQKFPKPILKFIGSVAYKHIG